jgi:hypothetical protein
VARTWRERARIFGPATLLSLLALVVTYHFVQPAPPHHIVFATGQEGGAYYLFGLRYQALLAHEGIDVTVRPTSGSVENIDLLKKGKVDVAFVQGGTGASADAPGLRSLASLYYEPIWIMVRKVSFDWQISKGAVLELTKRAAERAQPLFCCWRIMGSIPGLQTFCRSGESKPRAPCAQESSMPHFSLSLRALRSCERLLLCLESAY